MAIFNQIRVINPCMFVDNTWLDDIVTARVPLLVLRGFLTPTATTEVVKDVMQCRQKIALTYPCPNVSTTLGACLEKYTSVPENYFTELRDIQPMLPDTLLTLREQVYDWVKKVLKLESLQTAQEPELGPYSAAIVRLHSDGVAQPLHHHDIVRDAASSGLAVSQILHQLSCVVCLQTDDSSGALRIYNKKWQAEDEGFKTPGEQGYQNTVVQHCETCEFSPRRGDIYLFNPAYYHETGRVSGDTRMTMDFFFGLTDKKMKHAIAWS